MDKNKEIERKIASMRPENSGIDTKTVKCSFTIPSYLLDYVKKLKQAKNYKSNSYALTKILESYFNGLIDED